MGTVIISEEQVRYLSVQLGGFIREKEHLMQFVEEYSQVSHCDAQVSNLQEDTVDKKRS